MGSTVTDFRARLWAFMQTDDFRVPASLFIGSRLAIYALLTVFVGLLPNAKPQETNFWFLMGRWDGSWYLTAARDGYEWLGPTVQTAIPFLPLYPLLGRIVGFLVGDVRIGMLLVTNAAFAAYLFFFYQWVRLDRGAPAAERAIFYATAFPAAFVFATFYSEATFMALTAGVFWALYQKRYGVAIAFAALASVTRIQGLATALPIGIELLRLRNWKTLVAAACIIPLGTLLYELYIWQLSGDPLAYFDLQRQAWFQEYRLPWDAVRIAIERTTWNLTSYSTATALLDAGSILLFLVLSVFVLIRRSRGEFAYVLALAFLALNHTLDPTKGPPNQSAPRFLMAMLPCLIVLAESGQNRYLDQLIRWSFLALQAVFTVYFFAGYWVV